MTTKKELYEKSLLRALVSKEEVGGIIHQRDMAVFRADVFEATKDKLLARVANLEAALQSIASNTCCEGCQEAVHVARVALAKPSDALR